MLKIDNLRAKVILAAKGFAMGIADIIPGVSGGTIAFISGIYEDLIAAINSVKPSHAISVLKLLISSGNPQKRKESWSELTTIHWGFIIPLGAGILSAVLIMAHIIPHLLDQYPFYMYSLFFGLIVLSVPLMFKKIKPSIVSYSILIFFSAVMFLAMGSFGQLSGSSWLPFVFLSGALAICAMVLPGISGSYILLILGQYAIVLEALKNKDIIFMTTFICGIAIGLLSFARLLKFLLSRYNSATMAALTGIMIGGLRVVWPGNYLQESGDETNLFIGIAIMLLGGAIIWILNRLSTNNDVPLTKGSSYPERS